MRKIGIGLTTAVLIAAVAAPAWASKPLGAPPNSDNIESGHKITICHATSSSNPVQFWEIITVDVASSGGRKKIEGHVGHSVFDPDNRGANNRGRFDVIPAFTYGPDSFPGATDPGNTNDWEVWSALNPENLAAAQACQGEPSPQPARLKVIKELEAGSSGTVAGDFTIEVTGANPSPHSFAAELDPGTVVTLDPGAYSVVETGQPPVQGGWSVEYSEDCEGSINIGESKLCTITNTYLPPG